MFNLTDDMLLRYSRHILLPGMDLEGQQALIDSSVLVIGLGGLGCASTPYLVSSGVGKLTLVDYDVVELSNLQRQILHTNDDIGHAKVRSAEQSLTKINPNCDIQTLNKHLSDAELSEQIASHDLVLDCTDNLDTREQINRLCYQHKRPLVSGAAIGFEGQVTTFNYAVDTACYQCLSQKFGQQQTNCAESGVLAPVVGIVGSMQALEAIKMCCDIGQSLQNRLLMIDGKSMEIRAFQFDKNPNCPVCNK